MTDDKPDPWEKIPGWLENISIGKDYIYGIDPDKKVWKCAKPCNTGNWIKMVGNLKVIAGDNYL